MPSLDQMQPPQADPNAGAAPLDEAQEGPQDEESEKGVSDLTEDEELDLELAVKTAVKLMGEGGAMDQVEKAIKSSQDPAAVLGPFFATLFGKMQESFPPDLDVSPRVYLCKGGVLEQILDYMEQKFGLPPEFSDNVFASTIETIKAAAQGEKRKMSPPAPGAPGGAPQPAPPQGGPPPQGGGLQGAM